MICHVRSVLIHSHMRGTTCEYANGRTSRVEGGRPGFKSIFDHESYWLTLDKVLFFSPAYHTGLVGGIKEGKNISIARRKGRISWNVVFS